MYFFGVKILNPRIYEHIICLVMRKRLKCEKLLITADTSDDNTEHKALGPGELKRAKNILLFMEIDYMYIQC